MSKLLFKSKAYNAILAHRSDIKKFLERYSVPSPAFRPSAHLIKMDLVPMVDRKLQEYIAEEELLLDKLFNRQEGAELSEYERASREAEGDLASQFRASQYPPADQVRKEFKISVQYMTFGVPEALKKFKASLFEREANRIEQTMSEVTSNIENVLLAELQGLVGKALENLNPELKTAKRKVFRTEWVSGINEFLESLKDRNVIGSAKLEEMADKVKQVMTDADPEELKKFKDGRGQLAGRFEELKATMETMLVSKPSRAYSFEQ